MNDDHDSDIEARLARLQPGELSADFLRRLQAARPRPAHRPDAEPHWFLRWLLPAGIVAALVTLGFFLVNPIPPKPETASPTLTPGTSPAAPRPVFTSEQVDGVLLGTRNLGTVRRAGEPPVRLMEYTWLDREIYRGDDGASQLRVLQTRQEIVPVVLHFH